MNVEEHPMIRRIKKYTELITQKNIIYIPSCIIVEIVAELYDFFQKLPRTTALAVADLAAIHQVLLGVTESIKCTADAYESGNVKLFIGDWRMDKPNAEAIFTRLLNRINSTYAFNHAHDPFIAVTDDLTHEWDRLNRILDVRCGTGENRDRDTSIRYFHSADPTVWQRTMAHSILHLDESADYDSNDDCLILLCYSKVKTRLLNQIDYIQEKSFSKRKFCGDKITCVSDHDVPFSCPNCMRFVAGLANTKNVEATKQKNQQLGRSRDYQDDRVSIDKMLIT